MVGGALVVAADERELHRHLERAFVGRTSREDRAEHLLLEVVHHVVHVGERGRDRGVVVGERVDREVRLHARLRAHALDDAADPRRELAGYSAACGPGDVAHQAGVSSISWRIRSTARSSRRSEAMGAGARRAG